MVGVKARLFPGCAFVVGADTAKRVVDPKYYGNSQVSQPTAATALLDLSVYIVRVLSWACDEGDARREQGVAAQSGGLRWGGGSGW